MKRVNIFVLFIVLAHLSSLFAIAQSDQIAELVVESGHSDFILTVAFTPDGKILASGSQDRSIKLWNTETGQLLRTLTGHTNWVNSLVFHKDGKTLVSGSSDGTIKLWNIENGQEVKTLTDNLAEILAIAIFPDEKLVASANSDKTIKLWSLEAGQLIKTFAPTHSEVISSIAISYDGKMLASGGDDKTVRLWNSETGEAISTFSGHSGAIKSVLFSPNGKTIASGSADTSVILRNVNNGRIIEKLNIPPPKTSRLGVGDTISIAFSPDGKTLAAAGASTDIVFWNTETGELKKTISDFQESVYTLLFSPDGKTVAGGGWAHEVKLWNSENGREVKTLSAPFYPTTHIAIHPNGKIFATIADSRHYVTLWDAGSGRGITTIKADDGISSITFSPDGKILATNTGKKISLWDTQSAQLIKTIVSKNGLVRSPIFSRSQKTLFYVDTDTTAKFQIDKTPKSYIIELLDIENEQKVRTFQGHTDSINSIALSSDETLLASASGDKTIKLWSVETGKPIRTLKTNQEDIHEIAISPDNKMLASENGNGVVKLWNLETGDEIKTFSLEDRYSANSVAFSKDGKILLAETATGIIKLWNLETGQQIKTLLDNNPAVTHELLSLFPDWYKNSTSKPITSDGKAQAKIINRSQIDLYDIIKGIKICTLLYLENNEWVIIDNKSIDLGEDDWVVVTPDGRFDTNKHLDSIKGLHWTVNNEITKPLSLDVFMRQYYEPDLLRRVLKCNEENNCEKEFKPLPSIADINRIQPKVAIKEIKSAVNADLADVTIEVESMVDDVSISATDRTKKKQLTSGVYDLRFFRNGQLVGTSAQKADLENYIKAAPQLVEKDRAAKTVLNTEEDKVWRKANDIFGLKSDNVKFISPTKAQYTFRSVKLPKDGRKEVEFTAYAFNADKVKSATTEPVKFTIPNAVANAPKKGRAFLISIGVNASENPAYDLRYAANDARKMQEIIGERLKAESGKYSEVVSVPLVSDYGKDGRLAETGAQKAIIKGGFSLLAGSKFEDILAELSKDKRNPNLADDFKKVPNIEKVKAVEPEDTLIITFAGHGYADQSGIFYLLPYDIGANTTRLTTEALQKTISSDELSLWMLDITAAEMIFIIDACHSSAAVQGDGFKPGPMGSRGLGQLAYDKDMKILSATQANNVALELGSLEQGLLSYALLQDGIKSGLADADKNRQLFSAEWLSYAERRVPELYQEVKEGKRSVFFNGRNIKPETRGSEKIILDGDQKSNLNLQEPRLFDFRRRKNAEVLFQLP